MSRGTLALALQDHVTPELAKFAGDFLGARQIVGEGVVIKEELTDLGEVGLRHADFLGDVLWGAHAVAVVHRRSAARGRRCSGICSRGRCRGRRRGAEGSR